MPPVLMVTMYQAHVIWQSRCLKKKVMGSRRPLSSIFVWLSSFSPKKVCLSSCGVVLRIGRL